MVDGNTAGTCKWECQPDFYDLNNDVKDGCEYYCQWNPDGTVTVDTGGPLVAGSTTIATGRSTRT